MDTEETEAFVAHLKAEFELAESDIPRPGEWAGSGNTLGSIGLRVGLLSLDQIDQIITKQGNDRRLFGQIGVSLKFLTGEQVEGLLTMQRFYRCLDLGAILVFENTVEFPELLASLARYFDADRN